MNQIHRKSVDVHQLFIAPKNITFNWQQERRKFSIWFLSDDVHDTEYTIVATTFDVPPLAKIKTSVVLPDGYTVFHLIELAQVKGESK